MNKNGSILIFVAILSISLFSLFLLYTQYTHSNIADSSHNINYLICKNKILNVQTAVIELFKKDKTQSYDWKYDFWFNSPFSFSYEDVDILVIIKDEDSKININQLLYPDGKINSFTEKVVKNVLFDKGLESDYVNVFIDWMDLNNIKSYLGAEYEEYETLGYKPANSSFSVLDEFKLLKNVGEKFGENYVDSGDFYNFFTIYSDNKYNINTVNSDILKGFDFLDEVEINAILKYRKKFAIKKINEMPDFIPELIKEDFELIDGYLKTYSDKFFIKITALKQNYKLSYVFIYDKINNKILYNKFLL